MIEMETLANTKTVTQQPDATMIGEWGAVYVSCSAAPGTRKLLIAQLEDALTCVKEDSAQAELDMRWIESESRHSPFAFLTVCEVLGVEPGRVRAVARQFYATRGTKMARPYDRSMLNSQVRRITSVTQRTITLAHMQRRPSMRGVPVGDLMEAMDDLVVAGVLRRVEGGYIKASLRGGI